VSILASQRLTSQPNIIDHQNDDVAEPRMPDRNEPMKATAMGVGVGWCGGGVGWWGFGS